MGLQTYRQERYKGQIQGNSLNFLIIGSTPSSGVYTVKGNYGTITLNGSSGSYTYTLDNSLAQVQALGKNQTLTETFSIALSDGINTTDAKALTFTINGK